MNKKTSILRLKTIQCNRIKMPVVFASTIAALHKHIEEQVEAASKPIICTMQSLTCLDEPLSWFTREYKKTGRNWQKWSPWFFSA